jgi:hypothetical protein
VTVCVLSPEDDLKSLRLPCLAGSMGWTPVFASSEKVLLRQATGMMFPSNESSKSWHASACSPRERGGTLQIVMDDGLVFNWILY